MAKLTNHFKWHDDALTMNANFLAGIECEIESVRGIPEPSDLLNFFNPEADGSLRNHGVEYISIPMDRELLVNKFEKLHASLLFFDKNDAFTPRTSTHVHINCRSFTEEQLKQLMLFYAMFEEMFFSMVNKDRRDNIHCVPLSETFLPSRYRRSVMELLKGWHKYTAFNLLPIVKQGTVEFRHLQGTDDKDLLDRWIHSIENLWHLAKTEAMNVDSLMNPREHLRWFHAIFKDAPEVLALEPAMPNMIRNSLVDVKLAFI